MFILLMFDISSNSSELSEYLCTVQYCKNTKVISALFILSTFSLTFVQELVFGHLLCVVSWLDWCILALYSSAIVNHGFDFRPGFDFWPG